MSKWKPIETAPKDGTVILIFTKQGGQAVAWWEREFEWNADYTKEPDKNGEYPIVKRGAWIDGALDGSEDQIEYTPTHWMPLPEPPKEG